jgi:hypothetical protein
MADRFEENDAGRIFFSLVTASSWQTGPDSEGIVCLKELLATRQAWFKNQAWIEKWLG